MSYKLSICIPTYNRSEYLNECLRSILVSIAGYEHEIEVVISDNASMDNTSDIVRKWQLSYPWIRYNLNKLNIGAECNFRHVVTLAQADNVLVFGDDDKMNPNMIVRVLESIRAGYDLTICNFSMWDKQFVVQKKQSGFSVGHDLIFDDPNTLMEYFGLHLGYISSVVINKALFLKLPSKEYIAYAEYGFPFLFAVYTGIIGGACKVKLIAEPIFCNRGGNSGDYDWYKYFVTGSSLIFDELQHKGYEKSAVQVAKLQVLNDFVVPNVFGMRMVMNSKNNIQILNLLFKHYKSHWQFWVYCTPALLAPLSLLHLAKSIRQQIRRLNSVKS